MFRLFYRIHEDPDQEKLQRFLEFVTTFGYVVKGTAGSIHRKALQRVLDEVRDSPEEAVISTVMLRSMKQANTIRKAWAISVCRLNSTRISRRRFAAIPDLIVHRLIRTYLIQGKTDEVTRGNGPRYCRKSPSIRPIWSAMP